MCRYSLARRCLTCYREPISYITTHRLQVLDENNLNLKMGQNRRLKYNGAIDNTSITLKYSSTLEYLGLDQ